MNCLIVDSSPVALLGYCSILSNHFQHCRVYTSVSIEEASAFLESKCNSESEIDFVLINIKLSDIDVTDKVTSFLRLTEKHSLRCIVMADQMNSELLLKFEACSLDGFLLSDDSIVNIVQAISVVSSGGKYLQSTKLPSVDHKQSEKMVFTERQKDVIELLLMGYSNKKIASTLNLSQGTIKNYLFDLMRYMNVKSRLELVFKIRLNGYQSRLNVNHSVQDKKFMVERELEFGVAS
jgi:DNA-binding NarL/FixJ family response regulator